jgi:D-lactate dehydrogenase (cytochrome)
MDARVAAAVDALRGLFGDRCATTPSVTGSHGRDESFHPAAPPDAVVAVATTEEVAAALRVCNEHGVPAIAFGMASSLDGHVLATRGGICLDLSGMDAILEIRPDDLVAKVEAGVRRRQLHEALGPQGLFFPVDPGADATLGGMAATAAAGTTTVRYGPMRANVLGMTVVLADGRVLRTGGPTRKRSAGYDLTQLFVGSEGTLGVITELWLQVFGIPDRIAAARCTFPTLDDGVRTATQVVQSGVPIARCEFLDPAAVRAVNAHSGLDAEEANTLFFEFHGASQPEVDEQVSAVRAIADANGGAAFVWTTTTEERTQLWRARHDAHYALLASRPGSRDMVTDVAVPLSVLAACVERARGELAALPMPTAIFGHVADGNFHCSILVTEDSAEVAAASAAVERITEIAQELGGTCSGEHGIGLGKRHALAAEVGPDAIDVMRAVKRALDPNGILNPGKLLPDPEDPGVAG